MAPSRDPLFHGRAATPRSRSPGAGRTSSFLDVPDGDAEDLRQAGELVGCWSRASALDLGKAGCADPGLLCELPLR